MAINAISKFITLDVYDHDTTIKTIKAIADYSFSTPWLSIHNNCQKFIQEDSTDSGYADIASAVNDLEFPARTAGTATEDCWSVVIVKPISRTIKLIRFGAGNDREFAF